jgi:hypothetical protein
VRWSGLACVPLVGVVSVTVVAGRLASALVWSPLCFFGRRGLSYRGGGPKVKGVGLVSPLFLMSSLAQPLLCRVDRQGLSSGLVSVPLIGVSSVTVVAGV